MAQSGNGIDIGAVYALLTEMSARMDSMSARVDQLLAVVNDHTRTLDDHTRILNDHTRILNDHARQLDGLNAAVANLRSDVVLYHGAVTSQGIHYSGLEDRVRRVERHLKLEPSSE